MHRVTEGIGRLQVVDWTAQAEELGAALTWAECTKGRAIDLPRLLRELYEEGQRTDAHLLAFCEAYEVIDLYRVWRDRSHQHPAALAHIRRCISKGPLTADQENPAESDNRWRNSAFVWYLAGRLLDANSDVLSVEGIALHETPPVPTTDILVRSPGGLVSFECKRPHSPRGLPSSVRRANRQLENAPPGVHVIAIDYSLPSRGPGKVLSARNADEAHNFIADRMQAQALPLLQRTASASVAGALLFARVPTMTPAQRSPILAPSGVPFTYYRQVAVSSLLAWVRTEHPAAHLWKGLAARLHPPAEHPDVQ